MDPTREEDGNDIEAAAPGPDAPGPDVTDVAAADDDESQGEEGPQGAPGDETTSVLPRETPLDAAADDGTSARGEGDADEFAATRERIADPDDWRLEKRLAGLPDEPDVHVARLTPEEEQRARRLRPLYFGAAGLAAVFTFTAVVVRLAGLGPRGAETWLVTLACAAVMGAAALFPRAHFQVRPVQGGHDAIQRARHVRELVMRTFGVSFAILFIIVGLLELIALFVALGWVADLSQASITLARNYVLVPGVVLAVLVAGLFVRPRMPSQVGAVAHERLLLWGLLGAFAFASVVASFFALGIDQIVVATTVEARHGLFIQGVALAAVVAFVNLRMRFPDAVRIAKAEIARSKEVDRRAAETMHKRMLRNYLFAMAFVIGSIFFLVSQATGMLKPAGGGMDVVLLVYLAIGLLFLGIILVNFYQARQIGRRVVLKKPGQALGKRRFRPDEITRYTILGVSGFATLVFLMLAVLTGTRALAQIGPFDLAPSVATDFAVLAVLSAMGPYGIYHARETTRIRTIDAKFPDFLRDLAESQRAGMTLPRALVTASKGVYGPLTDEIKTMAAQVEWGVSFNEALRRFAERTRTPLIERTVSLVCEASASGGNVVDVLTAASDDAREIKNIITERKQQMGVYSLIVYIAFGVFLTVIAVLNSQFIPELANASKGAAGTSLGGIQFGDIPVDRYQMIFFHAALIQGIGGGLVSGVMTEGHPLSGLRHSFIMTLVAYGVFRLVIL